MTLETASHAAYIVAALLFILALAGLSKHETAKLGNSFGIAGMVVALLATIALAVDLDISAANSTLLAVMMAIGALIGLQRARVVEMTGMPELIALLPVSRHSSIARRMSAAVRPSVIAVLRLRSRLALSARVSDMV